MLAFYGRGLKRLHFRFQERIKSRRRSLALPVWEYVALILAPGPQTRCRGSRYSYTVLSGKENTERKLNLKRCKIFKSGLVKLLLLLFAPLAEIRFYLV